MSKLNANAKPFNFSFNPNAKPFVFNEPAAPVTTATSTTAPTITPLITPVISTPTRTEDSPECGGTACKNDSPSLSSALQTLSPASHSSDSSLSESDTPSDELLSPRAAYDADELLSLRYEHAGVEAPSEELINSLADAGILHEVAVAYDAAPFYYDEQGNAVQLPYDPQAMAYYDPTTGHYYAAEAFMPYDYEQQYYAPYEGDDAAAGDETVDESSRRLRMGRVSPVVNRTVEEIESYPVEYAGLDSGISLNRAIRHQQLTGATLKKHGSPPLMAQRRDLHFQQDLMLPDLANKNVYMGNSMQPHTGYGYSGAQQYGYNAAPLAVSHSAARYDYTTPYDYERSRNNSDRERPHRYEIAALLAMRTDDFDMAVIPADFSNVAVRGCCGAEMERMSEGVEGVYRTGVTLV